MLITEREQQALTEVGCDFSVLELDEEGVQHLRIPGQRGRKRQRVNRGGQACVVAGAIAFLNHACHRHANMWPAVWGEGDGDVGSGQWQVATIKRAVKKDEELYLFYAGKEAEDEVDKHPCPLCVHTR